MSRRRDFEVNSNQKNVVIIGGGITGLTTAFYLQKKAKALGINIILVESSDKLGGKIQTYTDNGFVIEKGPDSFLARKQSASKLVQEVGLEDKLVYNDTGKSFVLANGKLHQMPGGSIMGIPTQIVPFVTSSLFSPLGKARAAMDMMLPRSKEKGDQSLGQFFRRRLGGEVVENLIEPLLSGIYAGDIDDLSLMSTFPQFYQVEQKHRSLILGMKDSVPKAPKNGNKPKKKQGMFLTLTSGLESLVEGIENQLSSIDIKKETMVEKIHKSADNYELILNNNEKINADSIVVTVPHQIVPELMDDYPMFEPFKSVPSTSVATVALAFPESAIKNDIDGTGFVVSRNSDYSITACTWTHKKWPHSTPMGQVLLRCYVGRAGDEQIVTQKDQEIIDAVLRDLNKIMRITSRPDFSLVTRWMDAMPQYTVGHKERIEGIKGKMKQELPGVFLAGSSYEGLGVPDCIDQGEKAVEDVIDFFSH